MTTIASALIQKPRRIGAPPVGYRTDLLIAVDDEGLLLASYPDGTSLEVAMASAAYHDSGSSEDLQKLLALEA